MFNKYMVGMLKGDVVIGLAPTKLSAEEALEFAAWIVAVSMKEKGEFDEVYAQVCGAAPRSECPECGKLLTDEGLCAEGHLGVFERLNYKVLVHEPNPGIFRAQVPGSSPARFVEGPTSAEAAHRAVHQALETWESRPSLPPPR